MKTIKLGHTTQPSPDVLGKPSSEPIYPTINIDHPAVAKIPNKGTAHIKYHVGDRHTSMHKGNKKHHHSATLHVHSFLPIGGTRVPTDEEAIEDQLNQAEDEAAGS